MRSTLPPAQLAKAALQRLAQARLEPTPENYARAYAIEAGGEPAAASNAGVPEKLQQLMSKLISLALPSGGTRQELQAALREQRLDELQRQVDRLLDVAGPGAQAEALAQAIERLVRGLERGGKHWTLARKKDGVQRVLELGRSDSGKLVKRLGQLVASWDKDGDGSGIETDDDGGTPSQLFADSAFAETGFRESTGFGELSRTGLRDLPPPIVDLAPWQDISDELNGTVRHALRAAPTEATPADALMRDLAAAQDELKAGGASPQRAAQMAVLCQRARNVLDHRRHMFDALGGLCRELSASLVELAEDDSWSQGQAEAMNNTLAQGLSGRGVRTVSELLAGTRMRQRTLRDERSKARDALKGLI
ncbi:MAG TPA: GGDEF domain-containing protein, partial [Roseateles sp.]